MRGIIPTTLLPPLPRAQNTLAPLAPPSLVAIMAILKELYLPPIHGGFTAADVNLDTYYDDDEDAKQSGTGGGAGGRIVKHQRTLSGGSVDLVPGLGLDMDGLDLAADVIAEEPEDTNDEGYDDEENSDSDRDDDESSEDDDEVDPHLDRFEREWAEKWLSGVVRRAQTFLEEVEGQELDPESGSDTEARARCDRSVAEMETVLREATAVLAMMAGTSAAGSLTRHLVFPLAPDLAPALAALRPSLTMINPDLSPETTTFLASLAASPVSPLASLSVLPQTTAAAQAVTARGRRRASTLRSNPPGVSSPTTTLSSLSRSPRRSRKSNSANASARARRAAPVLPVLLHDAPMGDHLSVGVQTWGSAILLGREMAQCPAAFGLFPPTPSTETPGTRVLELGAGTGLLSILCRKLLDVYAASLTIMPATVPVPAPWGLVVATDFLPSVLDNLKICVDLNAPPRLPDTSSTGTGIEIAKLDWTTFPTFMETRAAAAAAAVARGSTGGPGDDDHALAHALAELPEEQLAPYVDTPFDLVLASDCVYDSTHAELLRKVARWVLRLPSASGDDSGGTFHILSPLRPTFAPELESIDEHFPTLSSYPPLSERQAAAASDSKGTVDGVTPNALRGEGLGTSRGLKLGVRGDGKKSVRGRRGEGRTDEVAGYWWWEVGWG